METEKKRKGRPFGSSTVKPKVLKTYMIREEIYEEFRTNAENEGRSIGNMIEMYMDQYNKNNRL